MRARRELTEDDKADAVWQHYTGTLDHDEQARRSALTAAGVEAATEKAVERVQREGIDVRDPLAALDASLSSAGRSTHRPAAPSSTPCASILWTARRR